MRHVIICGYGRTGQVVSRFLENEGIDFVAFDMDSTIVKEARLAGRPVYYGDTSDPSTLETAGIENAALLVISHDDGPAALRTLHHACRINPGLHTLVRTHDEINVEDLRKAGATEVIPETLETGMIMVFHSLLALSIPLYKVTQYLQEQRASRYPMLKELFRGALGNYDSSADSNAERLHSVVLDEASPAVGEKLEELDVEKDHVHIVTLVRNGEPRRHPPLDMVTQAGDVVVLLGVNEDLKRVERRLTASEPASG